MIFHNRATFKFTVAFGFFGFTGICSIFVMLIKHYKSAFLSGCTFIGEGAGEEGDTYHGKLLPNLGGSSSLHLEKCYNCIVPCSGDSPFSAVLANLNTSSSILDGEIAFRKQLEKWLGEKCKWNLCYRASRDGWSAQDFHRHCDNKGPTVVLVKANNCIFGGYTDQNWLGITGMREIRLGFVLIV